MTDLILSREQVRRVDAVATNQWGISGLVLMENAGRGVTDHLVSLGVSGRIIVACAKGNNGGDGFVIARHLHVRGFRIHVLLYCQPNELRGEAAANFDFLQRTSIGVRIADQEDLSESYEDADWIVDALLGTGAVGAPRSPLSDAIQAMNRSQARRYAVDVPSGLDCDTGHAEGEAVVADYTGTFVAMKPGFRSNEAAVHLGQVTVLDIGLPWELVREAAQVDIGA